MISAISFRESEVPRTLDSRLRRLTGGTWDHQDAPLSVRRFVREIGAPCPTTAMKIATDRLLSGCGTTAQGINVPIAVESLCSSFGATLTGLRPRSRDANAYSIDSLDSRRGHTGRVSFNGLVPSIEIPPAADYLTARLSVAHELGHLLIHWRGDKFDEATVRLGSSPEEEALAEYAARLLLIPRELCDVGPDANLAEHAVVQASRVRVTIHSFVARFGDPDVVKSVRGAVLWRLNPAVSHTEVLSARLTPQWHLCPDAFIPIRRCKARPNSAVDQVAAAGPSAAVSKAEEVRIGSFTGYFQVDAFAWGSVEAGTRLVLSVFKDPIL